MPKKYHIPVKPAPPRFTPVGKFCIVDMYERCARGCRNCVKKKCIYEVHKKETEFVRCLDRPVELTNECMNCLMCVQNCTRGALTRAVNPEYEWLGDDYWRPEQIISIWKQAATGSIPVSGAGYGGPFSGPGFDSMWTDMSEIVRPTRDGIHGREYISTAVDLGAKLSYLSFDGKGRLAEAPPRTIEIPAPFMIDTPPFGEFSENVFEAMALAAKELDTFFILDAKRITPNLEEKYKKHLVPLVHGREISEYRGLIEGARIVQVRYGGEIMSCVREVKEINGNAIVSIRMNPASDSVDRIVELTKEGAEIIQVCAGFHGNVPNGDKPIFTKDYFRKVHVRLVEEQVRDRVTLAASGGIAAAEHLAKIILCGADCAAVGLPFLIAMECRMCGNCTRGLECPVKMDEIPPEYGARRIVNLAAAWRNQLLEVLGAMGLREVRRLRAEFGRAMFLEDLERDTFGRIFAKGN